MVKVGASTAARKLIDQEIAFLSETGAAIQGVPKLIDTIQTDPVSALALPYFAGRSPQQLTPAAVRLLRGWVDPAKMVAWSDLPAWWQWYNWPGWWHHLNSVSRIRWTATIAPGEKLEASYKWHYFWRW